MFGKFAKLTAVVTALILALTIGALTAIAQNLDTSGTTLDPGSDSVKDQLIAEATAQAAAGGYDLRRFDFEAAQTSPNGQLLFAPVQSKAQLDSFTETERSQATAGLLYAKQTFTIQGQEYTAGVHVVKLRRPSDAQSLVNGPVPQHEVDDGGDTIIIICEDNAECNVENDEGDQNNEDGPGGQDNDDGGGTEGKCFDAGFIGSICLK